MIAMNTGPLVFWLALWGYVTLGVIAALVSELLVDYRGQAREAVEKHAKGLAYTWEGLASTSTRVTEAVMLILLWPFLGCVIAWDVAVSAVRAIRAASTNKAAQAEVKRLKEEIEALKDRLYELED